MLHLIIYDPFHPSFVDYYLFVNHLLLYYIFYQIVVDVLLNSNIIHGSLLTFGFHTSDKFPSICQITLSFKKHKDKFIRNAIFELLQKLALYLPQLFVLREYLMECLILKKTKKKTKELYYYSLGKSSFHFNKSIWLILVWRDLRGMTLFAYIKKNRYNFIALILYKNWI